MTDLVCIHFLLESGHELEAFMKPAEAKDLIDSFVKGDTNNIVGDSEPVLGYPAFAVNLSNVQAIVTIPDIK